jgi:replicative DNA helicase
MTRTFKMLAKSLQIPILLLCQLNREIETRQNKKPQLSDLRDTGSIEMDSDIVIFTDIARAENRQPTGKASLIIAKQRNGALGEIPLCFIPHLTKFKELKSPFL